MDLFKSLGPRNQRKDRDWFSVRNLATGEAEILIYDFIGFDPFFGGVSAQDFVRELRGISANKILVRINSPGGDVFEAMAIKTALDEHPAAIEVHIDGLAASAASWVGLGADKVVIAPHAMMMIHEPWNIVASDAAGLRKEADLLDKMGGDIAAIYSEKAGGTVDAWRALMLDETWYTDQAAVDAGLADEISGAAVAQNRYDPTILNIFKRTPPELLPPAVPAVVANTQPDPALVSAVLEYHRDQSRRLGVAV